MNVFRKALLGSTVVLAAGALAGTASADVFVYGTIDKDKDKVVLENVEQDVFVALFVDVDVDPDYAADAEAIVNQRSQDNTSSQNQVELDAEMRNSVNGNTGDTKVNQDVGNMVNQANVLAVAVVMGDDEGSSYANAQASAQQINGEGEFNEIGGGPNNVTVTNSTITASIAGSINDNVGVAQVNQNAGNINNQLNSIALAAGDGAVVALSEADLGQFNAGNSVFEQGVTKSTTMNGSVTGNTGVTQVNQSAGNLGNQGNVVAISGAF